jgi:hypothetical protein
MDQGLRERCLQIEDSIKKCREGDRRAVAVWTRELYRSIQIGSLKQTSLKQSLSSSSIRAIDRQPTSLNRSAAVTVAD